MAILTLYLHTPDFGRLLRKLGRQFLMNRFDSLLNQCLHGVRQLLMQMEVILYIKMLIIEYMGFLLYLIASYYKAGRILYYH